MLGLQLVGKHRGGKAGGMTYLTQEGTDLAEAYINLKRDLDDAVHDTVKTFFNQINKISERQ